MKNTFLDYYKTILSKVSFDDDLLAKEYAKALTALKEEEVRNLEHWVKSKGLQPSTISNNVPGKSTRQEKSYELHP